MEMSQLVIKTVPKNKLTYILSEIPMQFRNMCRLIMDSEFTDGMKNVFVLGLDEVFEDNGYCIVKIEL